MCTPARPAWIALLVVAGLLVLGCAGGTSGPAGTRSPAASVAPNVSATRTAGPSAVSTPARSLLVTHLEIPALGIAADVEASGRVPADAAPPGCPPVEPGTETFAVPAHGIATPAETIDGVVAWIFGHSRWQGEPGIFSALIDLTQGDELVLDGADHDSGDVVAGRRAVVESLYLVDMQSGSQLLADLANASPPRVILQTSVREQGPGRPWIFDRATVLARATNLVVGDLDDPCRYLLLFVVAS